ncbi:MAG: type IV toxin-antitoxin system AbiEi family antitoxin domain-containing protein [Elusimicrobia bacterium]|jgi:predicted transcriptional regulator of viral defense system|nr:type IV toxin-antitoxin system AbiEi family antitoxin domain-containing protein [Elusimicrobiota bacterium]
MSNKIKKIIELAEKYSVIRPKDVEKHNIPRQYVYRLYNEGKLEKISRGLYKLPDKELSEDIMLLEIAKKVPNAVICLISALRFHDMTTQNPFQIWIAIHNKDWASEIDLPLKIIRMTGDALEKGSEEHLIDNIKVNVYCPAKTVADCFKFRNKIGLDVAIGALKEYKKQNKGTIDMLWEYSKIDRVQNIIRPYVEAVYE